MADIWFYTRGGKQMDPISTGELRQMASKGLLKPTDMVWKEGMPQWIRASVAPGLFDDQPNAVSDRSPDRPAIESSRRSSANQRASGRYEDAIPSSAPRYNGRKGLGAGAKVAIVCGVVLLLGGLAVAAVLLKIKSSSSEPIVLVTKDKDKEVKPLVPVDKLIQEYKVDKLASFREHRKEVQLAAGTKYEITAESEGGRVTVYIDDDKGLELAKDKDAIKTGKLVITPSTTGRHWIEVINEADIHASIAVKVREIGKGEPGKVVDVPVAGKDVIENYKVFIRDLGDDKKFVEVKAGIRYEVQASSERGCRLDIYIDDHLNREVAKVVNIAGSGKLVFTPSTTGRYRIEVVNMGIGDSNFTVSLRSLGADAGVPAVKVDPVKPGLIESYKVFLKDLKDDRRMFDLKAGVTYEITAKSDKFCNLDIYLDDETGRELGKHINAPGAGKVTYTPVVNGKYRVEVVNMGVGDSEFAVEIRSIGGDGGIGLPPLPVASKLIDSYKTLILDLGDDKRFVNLEAGTPYEITVSNDKALRMDVFIDDAGGKEVAKQVNALSKTTVSYTPALAGKFRIEVVNMGTGDGTFSVEVRTAGGVLAKKDGKFPIVVDSFDIFVRDLGNAMRNYEFQFDTRYEFTVTNDKGVNMNLYVVDDLGLDVATDNKVDANCYVLWTCTRTGKYKVEVSNQGVGDATAKVTIKAVGTGHGGIMPFPPKDKVGFPKFELPKVADLPAGKPVLATKVGTRVEDALAATDPRDPVRAGSFCKVYQVNMVAGKTYTIDMMAGYDTYLRLVDAKGAQVALDDDGGDGLNSRLVYRPLATASFRIVCTTFGGGTTGNFTLIVRED